MDKFMLRKKGILECLFRDKAVFDNVESNMSAC